MFESTKTYLIVDSKDLTCPICFLPFEIEENLPVSVNCGHTFCSVCLKKIDKCAICQMKFLERQTFSKSILILSFLRSNSKVKKCAFHHKTFEGFCLEKKKFVCFDCLVDKQKIISMKDLEEKVDQLTTITLKAQESYKTQVEKLIRTEQENFKMHIDHLLYEEVCYVPVLKERLYKEIQDFTMELERNCNQNPLLEKVKKTEIMLEKWRRNSQRDVELVMGIIETRLDLGLDVENLKRMLPELKREIIKKQNHLLAEINHHQGLIKYLSKKVQKVLARPPYMILDFGPVDLELEYLVEICKEFNLLAMQNNYREILVFKDSPTTSANMKFNPIFFDCRTNALNIGCLYSLHALPILTVFGQILPNIANLQDFTLTLFKISESEFGLLSNLLEKLRNLKQFSLRINGINKTKPLVAQLCDHLKSLEWFPRFEIQRGSNFFYETLRVKLRS